LTGSVIDAAAAILGTRAKRDVPIGPLTTYRVGGAAALFVQVGDEDDLGVLSRAVRETGIAVVIIGKGSNTLVADAGFAGVAVVLREGSWNEIDIQGTLVRAGAAAMLPVVARRTAAAALTGFEWAVGVPGTIGGAVRMNAGGHGSDMAATLERVRVLDLSRGEDEEVEPTALDLRYRHSAIGPHHLVLRADLRLAVGDRAASEAELADIVRWRREHQPGGPNAGSVFTNPAGDSAGRLVDVTGLKGFRVGTAEVSTKHANFIQADEGGSADDVAALMREVQARVAAATGVHLHPETRMVGFPDDPPSRVEDA
jgi:UDP-N-acetylmuramate dehydrogenase